MSKNEAFRARNKLSRSPTHDSGFLSSIANVDGNLSTIEHSVNQTRDEAGASAIAEDQDINDIRIIDTRGRKSVSFSIPSSSSTFYVSETDNDRKSELLDNTFTSETETENTNYRLGSTSTVQRIIGEAKDLIGNLDISDPDQTERYENDRSDQTLYTESLLDPYHLAEISYSQLEKTNISIADFPQAEPSPNSVAQDISSEIEEPETANLSARTGLDNLISLTLNTNYSTASGVSLLSQSSVLPSNTISTTASLVETTEHINSDNSSEKSATTDEENNTMALNISAVLRGIEKFSSETPEEVKQFVANCDLYYDLADEVLKPTVLRVIRTRLIAVPKLGKLDTLTWDQIKAKINKAFKPEMSFDSAQEKLLAIKQNSHETIEKYGERLKKLLDAMNLVSTSDNADVQEAQCKANEKLAVRKFKQNLLDKNLRVISLAVNHENLFEAITFADEKREELNTSNVKSNETDKKQEKDKLFCKICKKKNHDSANCYKNKNKQWKHTERNE